MGSRNDTFNPSGRSIVLERIMERHGLSQEYVDNELKNRRIVLDWLTRSNLKHDQCGAVIRDYHNDPEKIVEKASLGLST